MDRSLRVPLLCLVAVQLADIGLQAATGQIAPVRILAAVVIAGGGAVVALTPQRAAGLMPIAGALYLAMTAGFLVAHGLTDPGTGGLRWPLFGCVAASVLAALWLRARAAAVEGGPPP